MIGGRFWLWAGWMTLGWIVLLFLTACGGPTVEDSASEVHLRLTGWVSSPQEDDLVRRLLNEELPEVARLGVSYDPIQANYPEKVQLMLATGTAPDVFMLDAFLVPALAGYGSLAPIDPAFITEEVVADFEPRLLDAFRHEGRLYGLPKDYSTVALFYDPEALATAGLESPPTTWQELEDWAEQLTIREGGRTQRYGLGIDPGLDFLLPFVWQHGGDLIDEEGRLRPDDTAAIETIAWLQGLQQAGIATFPKDVGAAWNMDAFGRGAVAMTTSGYFATSFLDATFPDRSYRVAPLPKGRQEATLAYVVGYVMPHQSAAPQRAHQLLKVLTDRQAQGFWSDHGIGLPPRRSVAAEKILEGSTSAVFTAAARHARIWQFGDDQRLVDETQTALQAIYLTGAPIDEALNNAAQRLERWRR